MSSITVQKSKIQKTGGVVVLPISEYERLVRQTIPTYCLAGKEALELDKLARESFAEYKTGKTIRAVSLKNALRKYAKNRKD